MKEKYTKSTRQISLNVVQTEIDSIRRKNVQKTGLRVYNQGYIGCAGAMGAYVEEDLFEKATKSLEGKIPYDFKPTGNLQRSEDYRRKILDEERMLEEFSAFLAALRSDQPMFTFANKINLTEEEHRIHNDQGLDLRFKDRILEVGLLFKEKSSVNVMDGFVGFWGRNYDRKKGLSEVNNIMNAYQNEVDLPKKKKLPVIFRTGDMTAYIKFLKDLDGNSYGSKSSLFSEKIGKDIFSPEFTLYQSRNPEETLLTPFFDVEGTVHPDERVSLVENGVLMSPFTDKRSAKKYDLPLTGSAAAEYDGIPTIGSPKLTIKDSGKTAKELLEGETGVFVMVASGGDFTPQGNFGSPVQLAFLFDGEKSIGRLPELKISSNVFDMYGKDFIGVSSDTIGPLNHEKYLMMYMEVSEM